MRSVLLLFVLLSLGGCMFPAMLPVNGYTFAPSPTPRPSDSPVASPTPRAEASPAPSASSV